MSRPYEVGAVKDTLAGTASAGALGKANVAVSRPRPSKAADADQHMPWLRGLHNWTAPATTQAV